MKTDKPKLTERQWEVLERMENGATIQYRRSRSHMTGFLSGGGIVSKPELGQMERQQLIHGVRVDFGMDYTISPAGRAALAARRLEREGSGNANRV